MDEHNFLVRRWTEIINMADARAAAPAERRRIGHNRGGDMP